MDVYEKSFEVLKKITNAQKKYEFKIYLIGGWAIWFYNSYMKSKDIDLIIEKKDLWKLNKFLVNLGFRETEKVLEKTGFAMMHEGDKIEIDVYSDKVDKLKISDLIENSRKMKINSSELNVISSEKLLLLKVISANERMGSSKGEKDLSDILALLDKEYERINFEALKEYKNIFKLLFKDFQTCSKIYPIDMKKYQEIKQKIKNSGLL